MLQSEIPKMYGSTGEIGRDGLLNPDQQNTLNRLQEQTADGILEYLTTNPGGKFPLVAMATGIGKGRIIHLVIEKQLELLPGSKILVMAGTKNVLVHQTHDTLGRYQQGQSIVFQEPSQNKIISSSPEYSEAESLDEEIDETSQVEEVLPMDPAFLYRTGRLDSDTNVHVATIQSILSRTNSGRLNPNDYDLTIIDEVHNIGTRKRLSVVQQFNKVVGFTATPYRHSGKIKDPDQYGFEVMRSLPLPEAQKLGLLPPLLGIQIDTKQIVDEIPMTRSGQIDYKALEKVLKQSPELRPYIADRVASLVLTEDKGYKTVIAVNFVWEAQELAQLLKAKGIRVGVAVNEQAAKEIHSSEIPAVGTIERYKLPEKDENSLQVLISPYVASEGFDAPFTEVLVWASPTDSPLRYTQYTGRLARRAEGKLFGVVVDCLYQTNQFGWSYNMGMWMKGDVRQLENGMLYLGPDTEIENLSGLAAIKRFQNQSAPRDIKDLQKEGIIDVQPTDFPITTNSLLATFSGHRQKLMEAAYSLLPIFEEQFPDLLAQRRNSIGKIVTVVTDPEKFKELMIAQGIRLKTEGVKDSDFIASPLPLARRFTGHYTKIWRVAQEVIQELESEDPSLVTRKFSINGRYVFVITKPDLFTARMLEKGLELKKDELRVQSSDIVINQEYLKSTFFAGGKLTTLAREVIKDLQQKYPDLIQKRRSGSASVDVISDEQLFLAAMQEAGAKIRDPELEKEIAPTEFALVGTHIKKLFPGRDSVRLAQAALERIKSTNPTLVTQRIHGAVTVDVVTDKDLFIREMKKMGAKMKSENIPEIYSPE